MMWAFAAAPVAEAGVTFDGVPTVGMPVGLRVTTDEGAPRSGVTVRATARPGLRGEHEEAVGLTDAEGAVAWTPREAGLIRLAAGGERVEVVVAGAPEPWAPAGLALLAVVALTWVVVAARPQRDAAR